MSSTGASRGRGRGRGQSRASGRGRHVPMFDVRAAASACTGEARLGRGGKIVPVILKKNPSTGTTVESTTGSSSHISAIGSTASTSAPPPIAVAKPIVTATSAMPNISIHRATTVTTTTTPPSSDNSRSVVVDSSCSKMDVGSTSHSAVSSFEASRVVHKGTACLIPQADLPLDKGSVLLAQSQQSGPSTSGRPVLQEKARPDSHSQSKSETQKMSESKRPRIVSYGDDDDSLSSQYGDAEDGNNVPHFAEPDPRPPLLPLPHSAATKGREPFPRVKCNTDKFLALLDSGCPSLASAIASTSAPVPAPNIAIGYAKAITTTTSVTVESRPSRLTRAVAQSHDETELDDFDSDAMSDVQFDIDDYDDEAEDATYVPQKDVRRTSDSQGLVMEAQLSDVDDDEPATEKVADKCASSCKEGRDKGGFGIFSKSKRSHPALKAPPPQQPHPGTFPRQIDHSNSGRSLLSVTGPSARRTAAVWSYFQNYHGDEHVVECSLCRKRVRRGKPNSSNLGTSAMRQHMERCHKSEWKSQAKESGSSSVGVHTGRPVQQKDRAHSVQLTSTPGSLPVQAAAAVQGRVAPIFSPGRVVSEAGRQQNQLRQATFTESFMKGRAYPRSHDRVRLLNGKLAKLLAVEMLPYSLVDKKSFRELMHACDPRWQIPSRSYFSRRAVPDLYREVVFSVGKALERSECKKVHLTTDMWSGGKSDYMAVTAHWVIFPPSNVSSQEAQLQNDSYRQHATLCMANFEGKTHTGSNLLAKLNEVTDEWLALRKLQVGFVASDNGSNIVSALNSGNISRVPCFAHVLHLVVNHFLKEVPQVTSMVGRARRISSHFSRSYSARNALRDYQQSYHLPAHQLKVDVPTRWNSILHMLDRLHEQQKAVRDYCHANHKLLAGSHLDSVDWHLMPIVCKALRPFEEATLKVSRGDVGLNEILTLTFVLEKKLAMLSAACRDEDDEHDVDDEQGNLYERLLSIFQDDSRIVMIKKSDEYLLASFLDPRFKASVGQLVPPPRALPGQAQVPTLERCKRLLVSKVRKYLKQDVMDKQQVNDDTVDLSLPNASGSRTSASSSHRPHLSTVSGGAAGSKHHNSGDDGGSLMDLYSQLGLCVATSVAQSSGPNAVEVVQAYMNDTSCTLGVNDDPLLYWQSKRQVWPDVLVRCAVEYLSCPPGSVMSERVFSAAGAIITDRRNSLSSRNVEKLTFVKMNEQYIPSDYGKQPLDSSRKRGSSNDEACNSGQYSEEYLSTTVPLASSTPSTSADTSRSSLMVRNDSEWELDSEALSSDEGCRAWPEIDLEEEL